MKKGFQRATTILSSFSVSFSQTDLISWTNEERNKERRSSLSFLTSVFFFFFFFFPPLIFSYSFLLLPSLVFLPFLFPSCSPQFSSSSSLLPSFGAFRSLWARYESVRSLERSSARRFPDEKKEKEWRENGSVRENGVGMLFFFLFS